MTGVRAPALWLPALQRHRPLDHPPAAARPFTGLDAPAGDPHSDPLAAQPFPQVRHVIGLVGVQALGLEIPAAMRVVSRLVTGHHRLQALAVVDVGGGDADNEGQSVRVRQDVRLGARPAPVHGARTGVFAPFKP
ncbi:predicted protein [Streptomyces viridosporus ATCC 14672]|uniref:Predicted protein n=1 Tax=Streptomyces viridosporus (strain ATCC 14672 / DSM 40746 / JCM 4963 / KCTC 9882 / NRRL B-12104 / FH 1290) TaxID=566461 RepID=D5ZWG3_STRV1|nr:predicted protein [Streptomyces viridosporus ATCC 14672]